MPCNSLRGNTKQSTYYNAVCTVRRIPVLAIAYRIHVAAPPDRTRYVENSSDCTPRVGILQHTSRQIVAMATLATSDTLRDILTVTDGDGAADAAYSRTSARSAEGVPGSHPLDTSGGDARAFTGTRKRKAVAEETERGHRPAIDNESEHVPQNASAGAPRLAQLPITPSLPRQ